MAKTQDTKPSVHLIDDGVQPPKTPRKGIYLLPNLITSAALFSGFYAMVASMNAHYIPACLAVMAALFLDTTDGRTHIHVFGLPSLLRN